MEINFYSFIGKLFDLVENIDHTAIISRVGNIERNNIYCLNDNTGIKSKDKE